MYCIKIYDTGLNVRCTFLSDNSVETILSISRVVDNASSTVGLVQSITAFNNVAFPTFDVVLGVTGHWIVYVVHKVVTWICVEILVQTFRLRMQALSVDQRRDCGGGGYGKHRRQVERWQSWSGVGYRRGWQKTRVYVRNDSDDSDELQL